MHLRLFECFLEVGFYIQSVWSKKTLDMISVFLNLLRLVLCSIMASIFENVPCAFEKNLYFASLQCKVCVYQLSPYDL